jgi:hypothetical protein
VILDWACAPESAGNAYVLEGDTPLRGKVASTGGWDRYRREKIGTVSLKAGEQRLTFRPDGPVVRLALIDLRSLVLVPEGKADDSTADVARRLLDDTLPQATRQALVNQHPTLAADLVREMTRGLKEAKEEYRRIPWIWRVSIAAGKRNDAGQVTRLLEVSLPGKDEPLRHWQAVVIGGGIINGVSQAGAWPGERLAELLAGKADLAARWEQALEQSLTMADDEKVPTGTRYDALRMLGLGTWQKHGVRLAKYLGPDVHAELQMGAVSGLADMPVPEAGRALLAGLRHCTPANRKLALDALLRDPTRVALLLEAVEKKEVTREALGQERVQRLLRHDSAVLRTWARHVLVP